MGEKKATRKTGGGAKGRAGTMARGTGPGGRRPRAAAPDGDLLAQLLELQERTAAVGQQLRAIGEVVSSVMRVATESAAAVVEELGGAADAPAPEPPPVAARPRRRAPGRTGG
jgi:hypothetical protein